MQAQPTSEFVSIVDIIAAVLRQRHRIVRACGLAMLAAGLVILLLGREYASEARFVPDNGAAGAGALAGLAAQFGLAAAVAGGGQSPDFYASLAKSRTVLGAVADSVFTFRRRTGLPWSRDTEEVRASVAELYDIDRPRNRARERDETIELLGDLVTAGASLETGIITIRVQTDWPALSHQIAVMILDLISGYNLETLQSRAAEERRFVEERLASQRGELASEEDSLRIFLEKNRLFANSPQLLLEHDRLQRKVVLRQQVVIGLAQAYEQSRIEEVRNTPVLTVVQEPEVPAKGVRRYLVIKVLLAGLLAFAVFAGLAIVQEGARDAARGRAASWEEVAELTREAVSEPLAWIRRSRGGA